MHLRTKNGSMSQTAIFSRVEKPTIAQDNRWLLFYCGDIAHAREASESFAQATGVRITHIKKIKIFCSLEKGMAWGYGKPSSNQTRFEILYQNGAEEEAKKTIEARIFENPDFAVIPFAQTIMMTLLHLTRKKNLFPQDKEEIAILSFLQQGFCISEYGGYSLTGYGKAVLAHELYRNWKKITEKTPASIFNAVICADFDAYPERIVALQQFYFFSEKGGKIENNDRTIKWLLNEGMLAENSETKEIGITPEGTSALATVLEDLLFYSTHT